MTRRTQTANDKAADRRHWADRLAEQISAIDRAPVISTGISPSGEIHIGNMREVLTGDALYRALLEAGLPVRFNYVADNLDPLRRVYDFLDAGRFGAMVGRPLSEIPCPCDRHRSYADHFLEPFLESLQALRVPAEVVPADELYRSGRMTPYIRQALDCRDQIAEILREMTGKQVPEDWSPFTPRCESCGRVTGTRTVGFSAAEQRVDYRCECGQSGQVSMAGGGKLIWRVDWPARWCALGVTVEPFGKDHATRGGSYETGRRIVEEVFEGQPPFPIPYEWIRLKGKGDMSSSRGNVLSIGRILEVAPPEALRYLVMREKPAKTIGFDPGIPLLQLVDQLDDRAARGRDERAVELSQAGGFSPVGVSYKHLVVVAQVAEFDPVRAIEILHRTGYPDATSEAVRSRMAYARRWLETFAPEELRFTVQQGLPEVTREMDDDQRNFLGRLARQLRPDMGAEAIHRTIYDLAASFDPTPIARLFEAIYLSLLGQVRGPRVGWFIATLGISFCAERFRAASGSDASGGDV